MNWRSSSPGLSAFAWDWLSFAVLPFSLGSQSARSGQQAHRSPPLWPAKARGKSSAFLQAGYPIGSILASGVWLAIGNSGPGAWRHMYLIGVLPALIVFSIRRNIPESPRRNRTGAAAPPTICAGKARRSRGERGTGALQAGRYVRRAGGAVAAVSHLRDVSVGDDRLLGRVAVYVGTVAAAAGLPAHVSFLVFDAVANLKFRSGHLHTSGGTEPALALRDR
jgi:sugar transport protein